LTAEGRLLASTFMSGASAIARPLAGRSLVLNKAFLPIHVTSVRRAVSLLYRGVARAVDEEYRTFDFQSWAGVAASDQRIGLVGGAIPVPRVVLLVGFDRVPRRRVRFSRYNIFVRDHSTCQYCGAHLPRTHLNLDHVVPRAAGGQTSWENVVCSCLDCNRKKGAQSLDQAGMRLVRVPRRPEWTPFVARQLARQGYREWTPFIGPVDSAYWNVELTHG
jgi:5-methylcytosine-specific restriction endonuclease McrA